MTIYLIQQNIETTTETLSVNLYIKEGFTKTLRDWPMPGKTAKQRRFMGMCSTTKGRKKANCPPMKVAKEFRRKKK